MLQISGNRSSGNSITICFFRMSQLLPSLQFLETLLTDLSGTYQSLFPSNNSSFMQPDAYNETVSPKRRIQEFQSLLKSE